MASAGPYARLHLARQITTPAPHHSFFYRPDALPAAQPTASKHWRQITNRKTEKSILKSHIHTILAINRPIHKKGKGSPYSITERRVPEPILVRGNQPAGDVSHKPGGRLPLLSTRPVVTFTTLKRADTNFAAWWTEAQWVWTLCLRLLPDSAWVQHANHSATEPLLKT